MRKDKFLTALLMTSCLFSINTAITIPVQAAYTMDQEAEISLWTDYIKDYANDAFGYLNRGNINYIAGEYAKAILDYDSALNIDKYNTEAYVRRANSKYMLDDLEGALKDYSIALEITPTQSEARFNIGRIFYRSQNYQQAVENMATAIKLDPAKPEYYFELARAEYKSGLYEDAYNDFSKAVELKSGYLDAFYGKGLAAINISKYEDAVYAFDTLIQSGQKYENVYFYKGIAQYQLGKYDLAVAEFDKALEETPKDGMIYNYRGKANEMLGNKSDAKKDYKTAKHLGITDIGFPIATNSQEVVQETAEPITQTAENVEEITDQINENLQEVTENIPEVTEEPTEQIVQEVTQTEENLTEYVEEPITAEEQALLDAAFNRRLVEQKIAENDIYGAIAFYDNIVNSSAINEENLLSRAELKLKLKDYQGVIRDSEIALRLNGESARAYFLEGLAYQGLNNSPLAYRAYALAFSLVPEDQEFRYNFANSAYAVGRYAEANEVMSMFIDTDATQHPEAYMTRAKIRYQMGEYYSAIADSKKYLSYMPKCAEAYFYSAISKHAVNNYADAIKDFDKAIKYDKDNTDYYLYRAKSNLVLGDYDKVASDYKKIVSIKGERATTEDHLRIAKIQVLNNKDNEALLYYDILISNDKLNDNAYMERARLFKKMGRVYDSINDFSTALRLNPDQKAVYKERGVLYVDTKSYRKGVLDLNEAIQIEPKNGKLYFYRAIARQATGDKDGAMEDFANAKKYENL